jgi:hypothetical protein
VPKRSTRKKKSSDSIAVRSTRRRQPSSEIIAHPEESIGTSRSTPARKAKVKMDTSDPPSTISKRKTKKKEVETPLRTIVTRRMARNQ